MAGLRILSCTWCSQSFSKQEHLARHVRSHTHEKPFACRVCGKAFSRNDTLLRHARGHRSPGNQRPQKESIDAMDQQTDASPDLLNSSAKAIPGLTAPSQAMEHSSGSSVLRDPQARLPLPAPVANIEIQQAAPYIATPTQPDLVDFPAREPTAPMNPTWDAISSLTDNHSEGLDHTASTSLNLEGFTGGHGDEDFQEANPNFQTPTWQTSVDFELDVFHRFMSDTSLGWPLNDLDLSRLDGVDVSIKSPQNVRSHREDTVRQHWFASRPPRRLNGVMQGAEGEGNKVDETYRASLSQRLVLRVPHEALPSADFLNLCIQMYFTRFNPIFPLIHAHTFRPSAENSLLLLSICSIGSLFLGSPFAAEHGQKIFERLNKAILSSVRLYHEPILLFMAHIANLSKWETILSSGKLEAVSLTQAGVISQTFGILSGRPNDLLLAQGLHGTVITWARRCGIFQVLSADDECVVDRHDMHAKWRCWAKKEEQQRAATALYILDAEHSALFKTEPLMRHSASRLPSLCPDNLWAASTAEEWEKLTENASQKVGSLQSRPLRHWGTPCIPSPIESDNHELHPFSVYCELEGINASISEARALGTLGGTLQQHELALLRFHHQYMKRGSNTNTGAEPFCIEILWHMTFMTLFADMNELEISAGREGHEQSQHHSDSTRVWAQSQNAPRCAVHGALILRKAETMRIGTEPAIHVPRALFYAALVWYCYAEYGQSNADEGAVRRTEFPEFKQLGISAQRMLFEAHGFKNTRPTRLQSTVIMSLQGLLSRMGHWEISRKFASLITYMVYGDAQGDYEDMVNSPARGG